MLKNESFLRDPYQIKQQTAPKTPTTYGRFFTFSPPTRLGRPGFHEKTPTIAAMAIETKAEPWVGNFAR